MKIMLSGYPRSRTVYLAVSYLLEKYFTKDFEAFFLNNELGVERWSEYMRECLEFIPDELVIVADGDMLISKPLNEEIYDKLLSRVTGDVVCARLAYSSFYKDDEYTMDDDVMTLTDKAPYSAVLQYCIWNREFLIDLLGKTTDPWNFEGEGSKIVNASGKRVIGSWDGALKYFELGAFSHDREPERIRVNGLSQDDLNELFAKGLLKKEETYVE